MVNSYLPVDHAGFIGAKSSPKLQISIAPNICELLVCVVYLCITLAHLQIKSWVKGDSKEVGVLQRLLSGSAAGAISQTTIYPMEVSPCMSCYNSVSSSRLRHACPACPSGLVTLVLCRPLSLVLSCHAGFVMHAQPVLQALSR